MPVVPQITIYVVLVWFLWGFVGWALGTWIMNQILGGIWQSDPRDVRPEPMRRLRRRISAEASGLVLL
jgi:hypothetical protein